MNKLLHEEFIKNFNKETGYWTCLICGAKAYSTYFQDHLIKCHELNSVEYYSNFVTHSTKCCICQNEVKFHNLINGYRKYCSKLCLSKAASDIYWNGVNGELNREAQSKLCSKINLERWSTSRDSMLNIAWVNLQLAHAASIESWRNHYADRYVETIVSATLARLKKYGDTADFYIADSFNDVELVKLGVSHNADIRVSNLGGSLVFKYTSSCEEIVKLENYVMFSIPQIEGRKYPASEFRLKCQLDLMLNLTKEYIKNVNNSVL